MTFGAIHATNLGWFQLVVTFGIGAMSESVVLFCQFFLFPTEIIKCRKEGGADRYNSHDVESEVSDHTIKTSWYEQGDSCYAHIEKENDPSLPSDLTLHSNELLIILILFLIHIFKFVLKVARIEHLPCIKAAAMGIVWSQTDEGQRMNLDLGYSFEQPRLFISHKSAIRGIEVSQCPDAAVVDGDFGMLPAHG